MDVITDSKSFLFEVYVNDFNDNYHRLNDEPSSELERAVRKIRRRYKKMSDYLEAMTLYNEYMGMMRMKHGGAQLFKILLKSDQIDDFIPPRPRMKNTAFNRALLKHGIILSKVNVTDINEDVLAEVIETMTRDISADGIYLQYEKRPDRRVGKLISETKITSQDIKAIRKISSIDYLEEYFHTKNLTAKKVEEEKRPKITVTDIANGKYIDNVKDANEEDDIIFYNGQYLRRSAVEELQVFHDLKDMGWNSVKIMKRKGVSLKVAKRFEKQEKSSKKRDKKRSKKDAFLIDVAMGNGYSADTFGDFEEEMLNFTSEKVFNR